MTTHLCVGAENATATAASASPLVHHEVSQETQEMLDDFDPLSHSTVTAEEEKLEEALTTL